MSGRTQVGPATAEAPAARGLEILLVEDNKDTRAFLVLILRQAGYRVRPAGSVAEAIEAASGPFDLLLSDIELPDGTGLEVVRRLRADRPDLPAIALSGFGSADDLAMSREAGFAVHLVKPVDFRRLMATIVEVAAVRG